MYSIDNIEHARVCLSCEPCDVIRCSFIESLAIWVSCERWGVIRYIIAKGETDQKNNHQNKQTNKHAYVYSCVEYQHENAII